MAKKKKNKNKVSGKEKTELKTEKNAKKKAAKLRNKKGQRLEDEDDIEFLIAQFAKEDAKKQEVFVDVVNKQPSPRINGSFIINPLNTDEIILFGGEFFNGKLTYVYNDLYKYNLKKKEWKAISSPSSPPPRCSHQVCCYKNWMYVFGGEFQSPSQNQFYHFKELWRFGLDTNVWEEIKFSAGPNGRSGHRVALWKSHLVLFGGFYDTVHETKYFNDLWLMNLATHKWKKVVFPPTAMLPKPRSGFQIFVTDDTLTISGGYSKDKLRGTVHTDTWSINLAQANPLWQKVKVHGNSMTPPRSGCSFAATANGRQMFLFGGVHDKDENDEDMKSQFLNDMYVLKTENGFRMFPVKLRGTAAKAGKKKRRKEKADQPSTSSEPKDEQLEENNNEAVPDNGESPSMPTTEDSSAQQNETSASEGNKADETAAEAVSEGKKEEEEEGRQADDVVVKNGSYTLKNTILCPNPRMNAMMAISGHTMYLFGGGFETSAGTEVTFNDMYEINLNKLETFNCLFESDEIEWEEEEVSDDDDEDEEGEDEVEDDEDEDDEEDEDADEDEQGTEAAAAVQAADAEKARLKKMKRIDQLKYQLAQFQKDELPVPNPHETLKEFFARTKEDWAKHAAGREVFLTKASEEEIAEKLKLQQERMTFENEGPSQEEIDAEKEREMELLKKMAENRDDKEIRRDGFSFCQERYKQLQPLMKQFEEIEVEMQKTAEANKAKQAKKGKPGSRLKK